MQSIICYVAAANAIGALRNRDNSLGAPVPVLTAGVPVLLKLRLFPDVGVSSPYPLSDLSEISGWSFELDSDYDGGTTCKVVADNAEIAAATVTDGDAQFTEIAVPISQMYTEELAAALGAKPAVALNGELVGYNSAGEARFVVQINGFTVRNRISGLTQPTPIPPDGYDRIASAVISSAIETGGYINSSGAQTVASNAAVVTMLSGGQAAIGGVSAIKLWFESGFRENYHADLTMSSKSLTLVSSGGSFVYRPDNDLWVSAMIDGFGEVTNTLNTLDGSAGFFATSSGSEIVVSAVGVTETFEGGPEDSVIDGLIASSTDGGSTWTFGDAGVHWGTNGVEWKEDGVGQGYCYPEWGIGSCCGVEFQSTTVSAPGALLSNTPIDTIVGEYRLTYTASGGLAISGGGVALQVSGGGIVASADNGDDGANVGTVISMSSNGGVAVSSYDYEHPDSLVCVAEINTAGIVASGASGEGFVLSNGSAKLTATADDQSEQSVIVDSLGIECHFNGAEGRVAFEGDGNGGVTINGSAIATEDYIASQGFVKPLVTSTDSETTSASIDELAGGTARIYTQPLTSLTVASVASSMQEAWLEFTVASGGSVSINDSGYKYLGGRPSAFEGGSSYAVGFRWGRQAVCVPLEE